MQGQSFLGSRRPCEYDQGQHRWTIYDVLPDMIYENTRKHNKERARHACVMTDWRIVPTLIAER